jgi:integrase
MRPRRDGRPTAARKGKLTELFVRKLKPEGEAFNVWDLHQRGLVLRVQPTGHAAYKAVYSARGRPRWYHVGDAGKIGLADARKIAARVLLQVAEGKDPAAERKAERGRGTFAELAERYLAHAKKKNKSWQQADRLIRRYVLPRWGKLQSAAITRADVRAMMARIEAPILANQVVAAASAIFSWAGKQEIVAANPCHGVERNESKSRERVLSDSEVPRFWAAFDDAGLTASSALKVLLLTGQRPGEVCCMRREHIVDGWWEMPGNPDSKLGWPGTKNGASHRVWLALPVREILAELADGSATAGFVFPGERGGVPVKRLDAAMRKICAALKAQRATPHDLRRSFSSKVTALGFGRDAMNRVTNHREGGIASVYDRYSYEAENKRIMDTVAAHITALAEGKEAANVVRFNKKN